MYKRTIDLMDESIFPSESSYAQNKNPKHEISTSVEAKKYTNQEIVDFVVEEMKDTLGNKSDTQSI
jgi:hypothetical protein